MLLDEPTSNLDDATEKKILEILKSYKRKLTIIMVAHRAETLVDCDRILELKNGGVQVYKS